ncbi:putative lipase ATG15 [Smittium mucronatum]|uniref:triacylglycerol lipase n=1 Tax=Smittium mucronatum TaxID=133383 RepID=A0A1R0GS46_9FUNG|nr:putative lipase ATG15 [Smittium mucronatum]
MGTPSLQSNLQFPPTHKGQAPNKISRRKLSNFLSTFSVTRILSIFILSCVSFYCIFYSDSNFSKLIYSIRENLVSYDPALNGMSGLKLAEIYQQKVPTEEQYQNYIKFLSLKGITDPFTMYSSTSKVEDSESQYAKTFSQLKRWNLKTSKASNVNQDSKQDFNELYNIHLLKRNTNVNTINYPSNSLGTPNSNLSFKYQKLFDYADPQNFPFRHTDNQTTTYDPMCNKTSSFLFRMRKEFISSEIGKRSSYWDSSDIEKINLNNNMFDFDTKAKDPSRLSKKWKYDIESGLLIPDVSHKPTLLGFARMAANSYQPDMNDNWEDVGNDWSHKDFGWDSDGLRGYIYTSKPENIVIISFKGTSASAFSSGGKSTAPRDRFNDNRLFSCCCANVGFSWSTVCDCLIKDNKCDQKCLKNSLIDEDLYIYSAAKIVLETALRYPKSYIALTGHSLGGSIASLMGLAFGLPVITFEAPGEALAASRIGFPYPPPPTIMDRLPIWHIGHTADPIYTGTCNGPLSICNLGGYIMESKCHLGRKCVFDTVKYLGWSSDIRNHRILQVIYGVLEPWGQDRIKAPMPECQPLHDCKECGLWNFVNRD